MILFSLQNDPQFGEAVAEVLGVTIAEHEERDFEDGEHKMRPLTSVRGEDVYVLESLYGDHEETVNDKLCRLLFFLGAVRDAGADRVTAVLPYLCYARKDRKTKARDPIATRYIAQLMEAIGVARVVTMDVHNLAAYQNAFRILSVHLEAAPAIAEHFSAISPAGGIAVVSPDAGGVKRADRLRQILSDRLSCDVSLAMMEKHRSEGVVSGEIFAGDVEGRLVIVIDDLISTGTTLLRAAVACRQRGAAEVHAAATHALLVGDAAQTLADDALQQVVITNTMPPFRLRGQSVEKKFVVLDVSAIFARAIQRLHAGGPIEGGALLYGPSG